MSHLWTPAWPVDVRQVWSTWRRGAGDPTYRIDASGAHWRALRTPQGAATLRVRPRPSLGAIEADAWGEGTEWALEHLPKMLGAEDDPAGFEPRHDALRAAHHARPHWRVGRGGIVWQALLPSVIEQKVTGQEAFGGFRRLVFRYGSPAPDAPAALNLRLPPTPEEVRRIPSWEWLRLPVDGARSSTILRAARVAPALERTLGVRHEEADRRLPRPATAGAGRGRASAPRGPHGSPDPPTKLKGPAGSPAGP